MEEETPQPENKRFVHYSKLGSASKALFEEANSGYAFKILLPLRSY